MHEGGRKHQHVQPPVRDAAQDGLARELGAVQEEQQADRNRGQLLEEMRRRAARRPEAGQGDDDNQRQGEVVGEVA